MIKKIESIKNIGNFEDYTAVGDVSLKKMNLIYAENGAGKTTIARIMQSLASGDGEIIKQHKRIGATGEPFVQIKEETNPSPLRFFHEKWNRVVPDIEVFDAHFVANNVYTGFEISSDHHKGLYQFVVGAAGVSIANKIERVKEMIVRNNAELSHYAELISAATQYKDVDKFCGLKQNPNVDTEIAAKSKELELAKQQDQIKKHALPQLIKIPIFSIEYDQLRTVLLTSIEGIGEDYLKLVEAHLNRLTESGLENSSLWAYQGICTVKDGSESHCPFCGQELDGLDLIKGYNQYFSRAYNEVHDAAVQAKSTFDGLNIAHFVLQLTTQYERIVESMQYWSSVLAPETPLPSFPITELRLDEKFSVVKELIDQKTKNPISVVPVDSVDVLNNSLNEVISLCDTVNQFLADYNNRVADLINQIRPLQNVENELNDLLLIKARHEEPLSKQCKRYEIIQGWIAKLKGINLHLQKMQKSSSAALFEKYGRDTNHYLQNVFFTPFQIADVRDVFKGNSKRPNLEYTLTFNGTPILQGDDGTSNTSFKNVLSEGDKNTIAFSFFMAKLFSDPNISDKIVVFDDPLTSLDLNRRNETINQLVLLQNRCKQMIVMSHSLHFLIDLHARREINASDKKTLSIMKGVNNSKIEEYELKREWIDKYRQSIEKMDYFVNNPSPASQEDAINGIRLTMELMLRLKFCKFITNQNGTFGDLITELERSSCTFVNPDKGAVISELRNLNSISWRTHHASVEERSMYTEIPLTVTEAVKYVSLALRVLNNEL